MSGRGSVLAFGSERDVFRRNVNNAASAAMLTVTYNDDLGAADEWLERNSPTAIVLDCNHRSTEKACLHFRYNSQLSHVPILALADEINEIAFEELFGWGSDDVLPMQRHEPLTKRLRNLGRVSEIPKSSRHGMAIVADNDPKWRMLTARALRSAGYGVAFASSAAEAIEQAKLQNVELTVSTTKLGSDLPGIARQAGATAPWLVAVSPKEAVKARVHNEGLENVAIYDSFGPPENVLFVANELLRKGVANARATPRLLFGTFVKFRSAGSAEDEIGYTYNINAGGIFVRTLAPLTRGTDVWLELRPPRSDRLVRLDGNVVWVRHFGSNEGATVPPGFGLRISGGSPGDLDRFERGYQMFANELLGNQPG